MRDDRSGVETGVASGQVEGEDRIDVVKPGRPRAARSRRRPIDEDEARRLLAASKKLYYRIGEVSELTGVKAHVLRYWETEFRWMAPPKSRSKQRLYRKRDIEFVWLLKKLLWDQRYTIAGARQRIQELGLDEALSRCADAESLDAAMVSIGGLTAVASPDPTGALSSDPARDQTTDRADALAAGPRSEAASEADDRAVRSSRIEPAGWDWAGLRVALESMQSELLELRGALQQGL
ncbi:MAG: MerR family transcriptional regulator [Myxococcota bacterium]